MVDLDRRRVLQTLGVIVAGTAAGLLPAGSASGNDAPPLEYVPGIETYFVRDFVQLNDENFEEEVLEQDGVVLILYYSTCGNDDYNIGVSNIHDVLREVRRDYSDRVKFCAFDTCIDHCASRKELGIKGFEEIHGPATSTISTVVYRNGEPVYVKKNSFRDSADRVTYDDWVNRFEENLDSVLNN